MEPLDTEACPFRAFLHHLWLALQVALQVALFELQELLPLVRQEPVFVVQVERFEPLLLPQFQLLLQMQVSFHLKTFLYLLLIHNPW